MESSYYVITIINNKVVEQLDIERWVGLVKWMGGGVLRKGENRTRGRGTSLVFLQNNDQSPVRYVLKGQVIKEEMAEVKPQRMDLTR